MIVRSFAVTKPNGFGPILGYSKKWHSRGQVIFSNTSISLA